MEQNGTAGSPSTLASPNPELVSEKLSGNLLNIHKWLYFHVPPCSSLDGITNTLVDGQWPAQVEVLK